MNPAAPGVSPPLRPVPLQELRLRGEAQHWLVQQHLSELDSLTPVRGQIRAHHHGSVLEVEGEVETIVNLCCDRCLQLYNLPLQIAVHELLELAGAGVGEADHDDLTALAGTVSPGGRRPTRRPTGSRSVAKAKSERLLPEPLLSEPLLIEALDDRLDPRGDFDPERWLFEQLSLQLPVVNRCGADCPGPPLPPVQRPAPRAANTSGSQTNATVHHHPSAASSQGSSTQVQSAPGATEGDCRESGGDRRDESKAPIDPRWAALRQLLP